MMHLIEVIGSPCAGKTTLLEALEARWGDDPLLALHTFASIREKNDLKTLPKSVTEDLTRRLQALFPTRALTRPKTAQWFARLRLEMLHACAHYTLFSASSDRVHLSDSRIWGKLFLEIADPRNPLGHDLLPGLIDIYTSIEATGPQHLILLQCPARVAYQRSRERTENIVRKELGTWARRRFFRQAEVLLSELPALLQPLAPEVTFTLLNTADSPPETLAPLLDEAIQSGKNRLTSSQPSL